MSDLKYMGTDLLIEMLSRNIEELSETVNELRREHKALEKLVKNWDKEFLKKIQAWRVKC